MNGLVKALPYAGNTRVRPHERQRKKWVRPYERQIKRIKRP